MVATLAMAPVADAGHLSVGAQLHVDRQFHVQPSGTAGFVVPLPSAANWGGTALTGLAVQAGLDAAGRFTFAVAPQTATGALAAIELLPSFSGFGSLVNAAQTRLLPAVLDALVGALDKKGAAMLRPALALASALGVYTGYSDTSPLPADGFAQNAGALAALARDGLTGLTTPGGVAERGRQGPERAEQLRRPAGDGRLVRRRGHLVHAAAGHHGHDRGFSGLAGVRRRFAAPDGQPRPL